MFWTLLGADKLTKHLHCCKDTTRDTISQYLQDLEQFAGWKRKQYIYRGKLVFTCNPLTPEIWLLILPSSCYTFPCFPCSLLSTNLVLDWDIKFYLIHLSTLTNNNNNNNNNSNNNNNNGLTSVHPWYGSLPDIK